MHLALRLLTATLMLAGLVIGLAHVFGGLIGYADFAGNGDLGKIAESTGYLYHDNASRFLGGIFFTLGLGFGYCLYELESKIQLFHFLLLCIFFGGLARVVGWVNMGLIESTIAATIIELVFPPVMLILQRKVHTTND